MTKTNTLAVDAVISEIAKRHLRIETLAERKSDSLDFHDVGVLSLADALRAAYAAGAASAKKGR